MDKVRIGFAGVGSMGQCAHLRNYATIPDCEVVAISDVVTDALPKIAAKYNVPKYYGSAEEMLQREKLDAIVASQPFCRHGIMVPLLLQSKKPIFTEKPIAGSVQVGEKVVAELKKSGTWMMTGYHKRSDPASMYAKKEIDALKASGELGKMKYVRITMPAGDWIANGFLDFVKSEGRPPSLEWDAPASDMDKETNDVYIWFVNYYIHQVNLMRYFLGESYKATYVDPNSVMMAGTSESGVACLIELSPYTTNIDWQEKALICFEHGWVSVELPAPLASNRPGKVTIFKDPGNGATPMTVVPQLPWVHAMRQQAMNFIAAVKGEAKPLCEPEEALEDLKVARDYIRLRLGK